jgi:hypothetical protein
MKAAFMTVAAYKEIMTNCWRAGISQGLTTPGTDPERFLGFEAFDVEEIHHHRTGKGAGTWFRLYDGRVVNSHGRAAPPARSLYDAVCKP